jgi:subtilisin family serine protease
MRPVASSARWGRLLPVFAILLFGASSAVAARDDGGGRGPSTDGAPAEARLDAGLLAQLEAGITDRFVVEFAARADLSRASSIADPSARGRFVLDALTTVSASSQTAALDLVAATPDAKAQPFWLRNVMIVSGDAKLAAALARLPGVTAVRPERIFPLIEPVETQAVLAEGEEPEWGVAKVRAPEAWADGVLGQGIVVANIDTGVEFEHEALVNQYRGNLGGGSFNHNYNWWDPTGICGDTPCDNAGHGSHTMGTMVGGDGPGPFTPDIGVAPGASWIAAKGCEDLGCSEGSLLSSGEFVMAPTDLEGNAPNPDLRADIVNNSWGGGPGDLFYEEIVTAWRAAGIIPVFSAGNSGPGCNSGGSPGDYLGSFSVGATDINDQIADFSSRGPSVLGKINPDVSAPGVNVVSSVPGGGYAAFDGTSMAAPHTAGALALVLSAEPGIIGQVDATTDALRSTALDILDDSCGGADDGDPNNVYGDGRIDAAEAVALVATGGTLTGTITDVDSGDPIGGARVTASNGTREFTATTASDGTYELFLAAGPYTVTVEAFGYAGAVASGIVIVTDETTTLDFALTALPRFVVSGVVTSAENGDPLEGATVVAVGTPVPPATTDASGAYALELPLGSYELRASQGGCTDAGTAQIELIEDLTVDFALSRKLDDFGHACRPIAFDWTDADAQTALYGDEFVGRLRLPFSFPFYGESYDQVYLSDNGYLNFLGPDQFNPFPVAIPSPGDPNAAIYLLWQDMRIDDVGAIEHALSGTAPHRTFVIEYSAIRSGSATLDLEVVLWEDGRIDMLYGDNPATADGRSATIGIENADGTDALAFGFLESVVTPNSAFRYQEVATGVVTGTVTDANDGLPVEGATVAASPGTRSTETAEDGTYSLRLLPGTYMLSYSAPGYVTVEEPITIAAGDEIVRDVSLLAPIATVDPLTITATTQLGQTTEATVHVSNTGSAPLHWSARERDRGGTPPELPTLGRLVRPSTWGPWDPGASLPAAETNAIPPELLDVIIDDPSGDAIGSVDVTTVRAGVAEGAVGMALDFASGINEAGGYIFLDVDQDPSTGLPAEAFFGLPEQDVGMEYFVDVFGIHEPEPVVFVVNAETFELVAIAPASIEGDTVSFEIPLDAIGDEGDINTAMVLGDFFGPTDWAPDAGHGTIEPFSDAPWLAVDPTEGTLEPGESVDLTLTLGGPDIGPGEYHGNLVIVSDDPRTGAIPVEITLTVELPETFGAASGIVTEAHSGEPLPAVITLEAELGGEPYVVSVTVGDDGAYLIFGPEGTWPAEVTLDGHVSTSVELTIARGVVTGGQDVSLHREQPHAQLDGGPLAFELLEGNAASETLTLSNPDGHVPLEFTIGEIDLAPPAAEASPAGSGEWLRQPADAGGGSANVSGSVARPSAFRWTPDAEISDLAVLVYADDPVHLAPETFVDQALQRLGLGYTAHYDADFPGFEASLAEGGWDLVIFADDNWAPDTSTLDALHGYVAGGGRLILHSWAVGFDPGHDLWSDLGFTFESDDLEPPDPVYWWEPSHPAFLLPNAVPELTTLDSVGFNVYGQHVEPTAGQAIAGYTTPGPDPSEAAMIVGPDRTTVFRGFMDAQNSADLDEDGALDGVELWENLITGIQFGFLSDAPWLTVEPTSGSVPIDGSVELEVTADATGLEPGVYEAQVVVQTNDPDNATFLVGVTLTVPALQQGINAGGGAYVTAGGVSYAADQAYSPSGFGYVGASSTRSTNQPIAGTDDDALYQTLRMGMSSYRVDLPDGVYRVDLAFAETQVNSAGARVFSVSLEGASVLPNLDVFAAAGGRYIALDHSFVVEVTDGTLDIGFTAQRGDKPIINGILVTHVP